MVFCLALFSSPRRPPSFGKPACKQVEAWSLNVSDSKPEVGSASAGQTSFAGVEKRGAGGGKGGQTAVGHLKPSAAGNAEEREGEGAGSGESRGARRRERDASAWSSGAAGPFLATRAAAACRLRQRLQLGLIAAKASLCSQRWSPERAVSSRLLNFAVFQSEPIPSGEPLSHLFSSIGFFIYFFLLAVKYLRATWSLGFG